MGKAKFLKSAVLPEDYPAGDRPELAMVGRSNAGKSSLLNALCGGSKIAKVSGTPGKTRLVNFFDVGAHYRLVDLPGYGYAAAAKTKVAAWTELIRAYLRGRANLGRVYVLVDARHGIMAPDEAVFDLLDEAAVSYQVVLTKADQVTDEALAQVRDTTAAALAKRKAAYPEVLATSARDRSGIVELRAAVAKLVAERG